MEEVFYPFGYRNLPGIEYGSGDRSEPASAAVASVSLKAVLAVSPFREPVISAKGAGGNMKRVEESDLRTAGLPVLRIVPFRHRGFYKPLSFRNRGLPRPQKTSQDLLVRKFLFLFHRAGGSAFQGENSQNRQVLDGCSPFELSQVPAFHTGTDIISVLNGNGWNHHPFANHDLDSNVPIKT